MNLDKVLHRFASAPHEPAELRRLARALGSELPREQLEMLRAFRAAMARLPLLEKADHDARSYAAGYVASMLDVAAEYESCVRDKAEQETLEQMVTGEGWRAVLLQLGDGARLPSEIAAALGEDRSKITRILQKLRGAGLVRAHAGEAFDGRKRPHQLTARGRRIVEELSGGVSEEMARGIRLAVSLFGHLLANRSTSAAALDALAEDMIEDAEVASEAVSVWAEASREAGLVTEQQSAAREDGRLRADGVPQPMLARGSEAIRRQEALWQAAPAVLSRLAGCGAEPMPVYVRTSVESSRVWACALDRLETPGRTIVDDDIVSQSIEPPAQRFFLLYDDPEVLRADRDEPTMQALMERAVGKFVVASPGEARDVPDGFTPVELDAHPAPADSPAGG